MNFDAFSQPKAWFVFQCYESVLKQVGIDSFHKQTKKCMRSKLHSCVWTFLFFKHRANFFKKVYDMVVLTNFTVYFHWTLYRTNARCISAGQMTKLIDLGLIWFLVPWISCESSDKNLAKRTKHILLNFEAFSPPMAWFVF